MNFAKAIKVWAIKSKFRSIQTHHNLHQFWVGRARRLIIHEVALQSYCPASFCICHRWRKKLPPDCSICPKCLLLIGLFVSDIWAQKTADACVRSFIPKSLQLFSWIPKPNLTKVIQLNAKPKLTQPNLSWGRLNTCSLHFWNRIWCRTGCGCSYPEIAMS